MEIPYDLKKIKAINCLKKKTCEKKENPNKFTQK